jgi:hypothetical protein
MVLKGLRSEVWNMWVRSAAIHWWWNLTGQLYHSGPQLFCLSSGNTSKHLWCAPCVPGAISVLQIINHLVLTTPSEVGSAIIPCLQWDLMSCSRLNQPLNLGIYCSVSLPRLSPIGLKLLWGSGGINTQEMLALVTIKQANVVLLTKTIRSPMSVLSLLLDKFHKKQDQNLKFALTISNYLFSFSCPVAELRTSRQVLCHLSHVPSPFCFSYFSQRVSHFCLG